MCTSCLKHKPPVIDVEQGSKDAPITLDSDSDEEKPVAVETPTVSMLHRTGCCGICGIGWTFVSVTDAMKQDKSLHPIFSRSKLKRNCH